MQVAAVELGQARTKGGTLAGVVNWHYDDAV